MRKVNGADSQEIVNMLVMDIAKLALIAIVIGDIASWFIASDWLRQFADKVSLSPIYFLAGDLALLAVTASENWATRALPNRHGQHRTYWPS